MVAVPTVALAKGEEKVVVTVGSNEEKVLRDRGFKDQGAKEDGGAKKPLRRRKRKKHPKRAIPSSKRDRIWHWS